MGNRLTQIATRTGDNGTTGLGDNQRVSKNSLRVHAMGDVDELNSNLGVLLCEDMPESVRTLLVEIQHQLFNLGGELSIPGFELLKPEAVMALDEALADLQRTTAAPAGVHPARRHPRRLAGPCLPHRGAPCRARGGGAGQRGSAEGDAAPVPQPAERPDVRAGPRAEPSPHRRHVGDDVYWRSERMKQGAAD
jgi:cob(I)alamin adenosyltransferase